MHVLLPGLSSAPNLHPVAVHFPIALWIVATGFWLFSLVRDDAATWKCGLVLHCLGAAGALLAVLFGFAAANALGHDSPGHELVHVHRNLMLAATVVSLATCSLSLWWPRRWKGERGWLVGLSLALCGLTVFGADRGGELVYRFGTGVKMETPERSGGHSHQH